MKTLIAIISCNAHATYRTAIRETWLPKVTKEKADVFFFVGREGTAAESDIVTLNCGDGYGSLPEKVQNIVRWALERGYECLVKIDNDVVLKVNDFFSSGFERWDFNGHTNDDRQAVTAPWGFLYTLSKRSMEIVAQAQLPPNNNDEVWVARSLAPHGITLHHEPRYYLHRGKRQDFLSNTPRPLRAPRRDRPMDPETPKGGIAYCVFLHWAGYHATPDEVNIREYHRLFKETQ